MVRQATRRGAPSVVVGRMLREPRMLVIVACNKMARSWALLRKVESTGSAQC